METTYHGLFELLVDPTVVPVPVTVGEAVVEDEVAGGRMTTTVDTPEVTVERIDEMGLVAGGVEVVAVRLAQNPVYQLCSNWRSLSTVQN